MRYLYQNLNRRLAGLVGMIFCTLSLLLCGSAQADCLQPKSLRGVNLSGAEFGEKRLPGVLNKDYIYPSRKDLAYFWGLGMNVVRVPIRWERIQRHAYAPLEPADLEQLRHVVDWAKELDLCVLLDLHNFGSYYGHAVGSADVPATAFIDVWRRLSQAFAYGDRNVIAYDLMNEPAAIPVRQWMDIAQQTVDALRRGGVKNLILVGSGRYSGAHGWEQTIDGVSAADQFLRFSDPLNNFAIELHQYADANYSGSGTSCIDAASIRDIMAPVAAWAKREKKRFFLGEFGVAGSAACLATLRTFLESMQDADVWLGWTYWSAGPWWGNYPFSIQRAESPEAPQSTTLCDFLPK